MELDLAQLQGPRQIAQPPACSRHSEAAQKGARMGLGMSDAVWVGRAPMSESLHSAEVRPLRDPRTWQRLLLVNKWKEAGCGITSGVRKLAVWAQPWHLEG